MPVVIKRDDRREAFERSKILVGMQKACDKRPVSVNDIEEAIQRVERATLDVGEREVDSVFIGEEVRAELRALDPVAWLRFSSVYLNFDTIEEFRTALEEIEAHQRDGD